MDKKRVILYIIAISNFIGGIVGAIFLYDSIKNNLMTTWTDIAMSSNFKIILFIVSILFCLSPIFIFVRKRKALLIFYLINITSILFETITFIRLKFFIDNEDIPNSAGIPVIKIIVFTYLLKNELDEYKIKKGNTTTS